MSHPWALLQPMRATFDSLARRQHSLVTSAQLLGLGWTDPAVRWALRSRQMVALRPGVLRPAGVPDTLEQAWLAAVLAARGDVVLSHLSAARLWELPDYPDPGKIDLLVEGRQRPRLPGVRGHRTCSLPPSHRAKRRHIPVTSVGRTLVDTCGAVQFRVLETALDHALRRDLVRLPTLVRVVEEVPVPGRRRIKPMLALVATRVSGYDPGDSQREVDLVKVLVAAGVERPHQQIRAEAEGHTYYLDAGWPDLKVGFEYDSVEFHDGVGAFHRDRERLRRLQRAGWEIWPITSRTSANEVRAIATLAFARAAEGAADPPTPKPL